VSAASDPLRASALRRVFSRLNALGERTGAAVGDVYALAARAVLTRVDRLEDANAERRYRARTKAARAALDKTGASPRTTPSILPPK